jgi:hypothetical protein
VQTIRSPWGRRVPVTEAEPTAPDAADARQRRCGRPSSHSVLLAEANVVHQCGQHHWSQPLEFLLKQWRGALDGRTL